MPEFTDKPGYAFGGEAPPEVTSFFRGKGRQASFRFRDVEPEEHAVAFAVAGVMQMDLLEDIYAEVDRALVEGRTFADFKRQMKDRLAKRGWDGPREVTQTLIDPATGETRTRKRTIDLSTPRRLKTIYQSNMRSARAAGQWDRITRTKDVLPYLLYRLGPSERHRPSHENKAGQVRRVDDPFWAWWMPPNGWGCKCHVRQISAAEAQRRGITEPGPIVMVGTINRETGEIREIPAGLDPAWAGNPGLTRQRNVEQFLIDKLARRAPDLARIAIADIVSSYRFTRLFDGPGRGSVPVAHLGTRLQAALEVKSPVAVLAQSVAQKGQKHGLQPRDYAQVQAAIDGEVWLQYPEGEVLALHFDPDHDLPMMTVLAQKAGFSEAFVSTMFRPSRASYVWTQVAKTTVLSGEAVLRAWLRSHPRP